MSFRIFTQQLKISIFTDFTLPLKADPNYRVPQIVMYSVFIYQSHSVSCAVLQTKHWNRQVRGLKFSRPTIQKEIGGQVFPLSPKTPQHHHWYQFHIFGEE